MNTKRYTPQEFVTAYQSCKDDKLLLDVRSSKEILEIGSLATAQQIPITELAARLDELDPQGHIFIFCQAGGRARRAAEFLAQYQFENVGYLDGGGYQEICDSIE